MKRIIFILIICVLIVLISLFLSMFKKGETPKREFKGPQGVPYVNGPFGVSPQ